jgi:hypothetical protein
MLCLHDSIRDDDPCVQRLLCALEEAHTLPELVLAAWSLARVLARHLVEAVLAARARRPTLWPRCPQWGAGMGSKGCVKRQIIRLLGPLRWQRRVGRGPQGWATPQGAPLDDALGVPPPSGPAVRSSRSAVPWRALCPLPLRPRCRAGRGGWRCARGRSGSGSRGLGSGPWSSAPSRCRPLLRATCLPRSPWRLRWRRCPWPLGPLG